MSVGSSVPVQFGDLLALARRSWIQRMAAGLREQGYPDYRRSDAAVCRLLLRGPVSLGRLGRILGVSRQAGRKVADGLVQRGLGEMRRDVRDSRRVNVHLSRRGQAYGHVVVAVVERLNREVAIQAAPADLAAARRVLSLLSSRGDPLGQL
ncbi:MAG: hypothetical protein ACREN7_10400, partial [Candidatus Dormibacteria bacterium]